MSPEPRVHPSAAAGFERAVADYEAGRPSFPPEAVALLTRELGLAPGRTCIELGPGTGKLTELLRPAGARIVGIEPVAAMRAAFARNLPGLGLVGGVAEELPLRDGCAQAAVAAQAFHWFDGPRALRELARTLVDGSSLGLIWNVRDEDTPWVRAMTETIEPYRGTTPSHRSMRWREAFAGTDAFADPERTSFPYVHRTSPERTVARVLSISFIAILPDEERAAVADRIREIVPAGGTIDVPYRTDVWLSRRSSATIA
ncbi:MAG TPA: class I SAM-dependent methyltransferase [Actinomycetota bacterium]|nr:class I SAM-dependent methyltransferase [Actinomycetota bacterium]